MGHCREAFLNGLLAALVVSSILLSSHIWFPSEELPLIGSGEARVQVAPPEGEAQMPDIHRPERIYIQTEANRAALLPAGTEPYQRTWEASLAVLRTIKPGLPPALEEEKSDTGDLSITLILPVSLPLTQWAEQWGWGTEALPSGDQAIDRLRFRLGEAAGIYPSGPVVDEFRLASLSPGQQQTLRGIAGGVDPALLLTYRPISPPSVAVRLLAGLSVPAVESVPWARVSARSPDPKWEESRYFPDLSVVRQIDEKDARSFTDGQRLLRLTPAGVLEYRTADVDGAAPDLARAEALARDWVGARGGWQPNLVLAWHAQESGRTILGFELRHAGPFPVESAGGALQVQMTADPSDAMTDRVISLRRYPELMPAFDKKVAIPVITPEAALAVAEQRFPRLLLFETVREMHLAYLVQPGSQLGDVGWQIEPAWVIQVGEERVYVPAMPDSLLHPVQVGPTAMRG